MEIFMLSEKFYLNFIFIIKYLYIQNPLDFPYFTTYKKSRFPIFHLWFQAAHLFL